MPEHEYDPEQALQVLMLKIRERNEVLAAQIQAAIDAGKDIEETEPSLDRRKKPRIYRKAVPFTHQEALAVAIDALQAHFVEQLLFKRSAAVNFTKSAVGVARKGLFQKRLNISKEPEEMSLKQMDVEKEVEIEVQIETQIDKSGPETAPLKKPDGSEIEERKRQLGELRALVNFQPD